MVSVGLTVGYFIIKDNDDEDVMEEKEEENSNENFWIFESKKPTNPIQTYPTLVGGQVGLI